MVRPRFGLSLLLLWSLTTVSCSAKSLNLSGEQKQRADQLISVFENESLVPAYDYIENLRDGRGYTAGRSGFCTACGDLLDVVNKFNLAKPQNSLQPYTTLLRQLAEANDDNVSGLAGFTNAWKLSAGDPLFKEAQDQVSDDHYFQPALIHAREIGVKLPLTIVALYEAVIQHGDGDDPDSLGALISRTNQQVHGTPASGMDEVHWLGTFLIVRKQDLLNPRDPDSRDAWRESVGRADVMLRIFKNKNWQFAGPLKINPFGKNFEVP